MDEPSIARIAPSGDPFVAALAVGGQDHPHDCSDGWVYLGYTAYDGETGDEVEMVEALPCRRCAEEARA
jgi:hypothetical protein